MHICTSNIAIRMQVEHGHKSSGAMKDFCDGKSFNTHPLFSIKTNALEVFLYFDELEACNPLGSKTKKHKLGNAKVSLCQSNYCLLYLGNFYFYVG